MGTNGPPRDPRTWRELASVIAEDYQTHDRRFSTPGFQALAVQRFGAFTARRRSTGQRTDAPYAFLFVLYRILFVVIRNVYGIEIYHDTPIGRRLLIGHQHGIAIHRLAAIGDDCHINHGVTFGQGTSGGPDQVPHVGDRVYIGPGAILLGGIGVGDDVRIGPGALVIANVPDGATVFAAPSRILKLPRPDRRPDAGQSG